MTEGASIRRIVVTSFYCYSLTMYMEDSFIVFPDGDVQEIQNRLSVSDIVDVNGIPLPLPLPTNRMIAYRVSGKRQKEYKGGSETYFLLELLSAADLEEYV